MRHGGKSSQGCEKRIVWESHYVVIGFLDVFLGDIKGTLKYDSKRGIRPSTSLISMLLVFPQRWENRLSTFCGIGASSLILAATVCYPDP